MVPRGFSSNYIVPLESQPCQVVFVSGYEKMSKCVDTAVVYDQMRPVPRGHRAVGGDRVYVNRR